jgi:hypothetical protein
MYKYIFLVCLLVMAVGVMVEAQGMSGMQQASMMPQEIESSQPQMPQQMPPAVRMLGMQPPPTASAPGGNMANALSLARQMRLYNPFLQRQLLASSLYGIDLNDLLLMHYFDFGLF